MAIEGIPLKALLFRAISVWNMGKLWLEDNWIDLRVADSYFQTYIVAFTSNYWVECSTQRKSLRVLWGGPCWLDGHVYSKNTNPGHTIETNKSKSHNIQIMNRGWVHQWSEYIRIMNVKICWNHLETMFPPSQTWVSPWFSCHFSLHPVWRLLRTSQALRPSNSWRADRGGGFTRTAVVFKNGDAQKWLTLIVNQYWSILINVNQC